LNFHVNKLKQKQGGFAALIASIGTDNFVGNAKDMLRNVMEAIALGQKVMDATDDPVVKYKLDELLERLRDGAKKLIVAAQEAHKDPHNKQKRDEVNRINKELEDVIDQVMRLLDPANPLSSKDRILMGTQVVDILAAKVALHAAEGGANLEKVSKKSLVFLKERKNKTTKKKTGFQGIVDGVRSGASRCVSFGFANGQHGAREQAKGFDC
jgi:hypothetical protein